MHCALYTVHSIHYTVQSIHSTIEARNESEFQEMSGKFKKWVNDKIDTWFYSFTLDKPWSFPKMSLDSYACSQNRGSLDQTGAPANRPNRIWFVGITTILKINAGITLWKRSRSLTKLWNGPCMDERAHSITWTGLPDLCHRMLTGMKPVCGRMIGKPTRSRHRHNWINAGFFLSFGVF